jgi:hypothetical protein
MAVTFGWLTHASILMGPTLLITTIVFLFDLATCATRASYETNVNINEFKRTGSFLTYTVVPSAQVIAIAGIVLYCKVTLTVESVSTDIVILRFRSRTRYLL